MSDTDLPKNDVNFSDREPRDVASSTSEAEFKEAIREGDFLLARPVEAQEQGLALRFLQEAYAERELHATGALLARFAEPRCQALFLIHNPLQKPAPLGLSLGWQLYDFYFLEYLAMDAALAPEESAALARRWLLHLTRQQGRVLLSVAPPEGASDAGPGAGAGLEADPEPASPQNHRDVAIKNSEAKLRMLEELGFRCLTEDYMQPALRGSDEPSRHWLLGAGAWEDFSVDDAIRSLYREVYAHAMERPQNRGLLHL